MSGTNDARRERAGLTDDASSGLAEDLVSSGDGGAVDSRDTSVDAASAGVERAYEKRKGNEDSARGFETRLGRRKKVERRGTRFR